MVVNKTLRITAIALIVAATLGLVTWELIRPKDPLFRGKPESYWVTQLTYGDDAQVEQWRGYGSAGVLVLVRALEGAKRPGDRFYRATYRNLAKVLPGKVVRVLPAPRMDITRSERLKIVELLSRLSKDAREATAVMTLALEDEDHSVRQIAINFFTRGEDETCLLNQLEPRTKARLLPKFVHAMHDPNTGVRNNAAVALRFYPEAAKEVTPVLLNALGDPDPKVQRLAGIALRQVDPAAFEKHAPEGAGSR